MPPRILVVDDEPSIRQVLKAQLGRAGYAVVFNKGGADSALHVAVIAAYSGISGDPHEEFTSK